MAIYLDSAKLDQVQQAKKLGWVYGVATNPMSVHTVEQFDAEGVGIRSSYKELTWKKY